MLNLFQHPEEIPALAGMAKIATLFAIAEHARI
jgi:hypothetical protein